MFIHVKEKLPSEECICVCRVIDDNGKVSYRIDTFRKPSVFQEKYEGISNGFQKDQETSLRTEAWMKIDDDYESHLIKFDEERKAVINIKCKELVLELGEMTKTIDGDPIIFTYPFTCKYDGKVFNDKIHIYWFDKDKDAKMVLKSIELSSIIKESNDPVLIEYFDKYFSKYFIKEIFFKEK
jgi:hypothetical protein